MIQLVLLMMLSLCFLASSTPVVYYVTPDYGNCIVNGRALSPCYTLQQLNRVSNESSVELRLLSGTHLVPENQTLNFSVFNDVIIKGWNEEQEVVVECQSRANITFLDVAHLNISSLHFMFCTIQYGNERYYALSQTVNIERCLFEGSKEDYVFDINRLWRLSVDGLVYIQIMNCTFASNYGAVTSGEYISVDAYRNVALQINDTLFQDHVEVYEFGKTQDILTFNYRIILNVMNCKFIDNMIRPIRASNSSVQIIDSTFYNNSGGLTLSLCNATIDSCHFMNNPSRIVRLFGGLSKSSSILGTYVVMNSVFKGNKDGALGYFHNHTRVFITDCLFEDNTASASGGALRIISALAPNITNTQFNNNSARYGGAISSSSAGFTVINCWFNNNSATFGGALYITNSNSMSLIYSTTFISNEAENDGGAICYKGFESNIEFIIRKGYSVLNSAGNNGGFAYISKCQFSTDDYDYYIGNNSALNGGAIYAQDASIESRSTYIVVADNMARGSGGALYLSNSRIILTASFDSPDHNEASTLIFQHNVAGDKGGAIFVVDKNCEELSSRSGCFLVSYISPRDPIRFTNNSASQGAIVYGGLLDRCLYDNKQLGIDLIKSVLEYEPAPLDITSTPVKVCLCTENMDLDCSMREVALTKTRGEVINLIGAVVDQNSNPKASYVRARYGEFLAKLGRGEGYQETGGNCTKLAYHIFTSHANATLVLESDGYCERSNFSSIIINITVMPCFRGFQSNEDSCDCDGRLTNLSSAIICNANTDSVERKGSIWLRYDEEYLKVHANCPLDYCQDAYDTISLAYPDEQCAYNRSGVICGACQDNYSIALGGSKCLQCNSSYTLIWLIPVFAVAGIALVALLLVFNMTVAHGTLNGLIFYANIVSITGLTSLQNCSIHPILSVFIAWLNLDFGVETCFYSGMDTYQKTWLQFAFPLYIWLLVGAIILVSRYSVTAVKVFGRNNIAILATLFLLSYAKILKTIITALNSSQVLQGSANDTSDPLVPYKVWTYDGNIEYLKGKHVPLFVVALVFLIFVFLPYTLLLTFGQWIRSVPTQDKCALLCIRSTAFVSIMDAYHAPYNDRHRYWTGLMLLTRCILFLAFAFSYNDNQLLENMYITALVLIGILTLKTIATKVYKNFYINVLEICFLLNLVILSATLTGNSSSDGVICRCTSASISISLIMFIGMLTYHAYLQLLKTKCFKSIKDTFLAKRQYYYRTLHDGKEKAAPPAVIPVQKMPTTTSVELRESLLASDVNY